MENEKTYLIGKCRFCGSIFGSGKIETDCPFCSGTIEYKTTSIPFDEMDMHVKLNNIYDYLYPKPIEVDHRLNRKHDVFEFLNIHFIYKKNNDKEVLFRVWLNWNYDTKSSQNNYAIYENPEKDNEYYIDTFSLDNMETEGLFVKSAIFALERGSRNKFLDIIKDIGPNLHSFSNYFQLYNSIDFQEGEISAVHNKKTFYEFASVNYVLHILQFLKINLFENIDEKLIKFNTFLGHEYCDKRVEAPLEDFIDKDSLNEEFSFNDLYNDFDNSIYIEDYEDLYYKLIEDTIEEGCVGAIPPAPNGVSTVCYKPLYTYDKLDKMGYNPKLNIYSNSKGSKIIPTFSTNEDIVYIDSDPNSLLNGINYFDSMTDLQETLSDIDDIYDEKTILLNLSNNNGFDIPKILSRVKSDDELIQTLISLNNKFDSPDEDEKVVSNYKFDTEGTSLQGLRQFSLGYQTIEKFKNSYYKLKEIRWNKNMEGYIFINEWNNVAAYIIVENNYPYKTKNDFEEKTITRIIALEVASSYRDTNNIQYELLRLAESEFNASLFICRDSQNIQLMNNDSSWYEDNVNFGNHYFINRKNFITKGIDILNEAKDSTSGNTFSKKRKAIENLIYNTMNILDKTGMNTQKYKKLFESMSDEKFKIFMNRFKNDPKANFYLEVLPNKNDFRLKDDLKALKYLNVPSDEYVYYRHSTDIDNPIRTRYKVPVMYVNLRRLRVKRNCFKEQALITLKRLRFAVNNISQAV